VSERLGVSQRTLARRLADDGVTFKNLVDDVRKERAQEYLKGGRHSLEEIAALLGFADASAFSRAYKRWEGSTPGQARGAPPARASSQRG
jgi:AraC-like DNA-binding protein